MPPLRVFSFRCTFHPGDSHASDFDHWRETVKKGLCPFLTKGLQTAARTSCPLTADKTHTCSLSCIFCQVHAPTENDQNPFAACGRQTLRGFFDTLKYIQYSLFLRFPNFELGQKSCLRLLAELRGAALYFSVAFTKDFPKMLFTPGGEFPSGVKSCTGRSGKNRPFCCVPCRKGGSATHKKDGEA